MDYLVKNKQKKLLHEKYAFRYFKKLTENRIETVDEYQTLNDQEIQTIKKIRQRSLFLAALFGTLGVLFLYVPLYIFPNLFWSFSLDLPYFGLIPIPVAFFAYGMLLAIIEITALVMLNLRTVYKVAYVCGFPNIDDPDYEKHIQTLFEVGLEKPNKEILMFGINPLAGLSKFNIFLFTFFNLVKATVSNVLVKMVLARVLGRFALRAYIDLIGIPIFSFWNMYTTNRVIREAKIRIMAPTMIAHLTDKLYEKLKHNEDFKTTLYAALQFIAVTKRNFHHNHFLLVDKLLHVFSIEIKKQEPLSRIELIHRAEMLDEDARQGLAKLLVFGMLIDGRLSYREKGVLDELCRLELIHINFETLVKWENAFIQGRGLASLLEAKIV